MSMKDPWGTLTGVRPAKLMNSLIDEYGEEKAVEIFENTYEVSPQKAEFALRVAKKERPVINLSLIDNYSLYIGIPFCPSRCSYCSFVSHSITSPSAKKLLPQYLEKLCCELEATAGIAKRLGLRLLTIYVGGGTPSVLSAGQTQMLCDAVCKNFDMSDVTEFTFEAGRPDTITKQKLEMLRRFPVTRISVNPQTYNDDVLKNIGRLHTAQQTVDAFYLARECGFDIINTDLIAGLPGDTPEGFMHSLDVTAQLSPECVTVHTLAQKRAARQQMTDDQKEKGGAVIGQMIQSAAKTLDGLGYEPYYMYRQTDSLGGFENAGWSKPSFESPYNIFMMEESQCVFACGAGGVTKLKTPGVNCVERVFNFKYPYEYISRFDELISRKQKITDFYNGLK